MTTFEKLCHSESARHGRAIGFNSRELSWHAMLPYNIFMAAYAAACARFLADPCKARNP